MLRRPPNSTLFPTRRSSDLGETDHALDVVGGVVLGQAEHHHVAAVGRAGPDAAREQERREDRKSTRLNSSHVENSYAVFCLKKKKCAVLVASVGGAQALEPL